MCKRLLDVECYSAAADLYQMVKLYREAINACIDGNNWEAAKSIAVELAPKYEEYVEQKYVEYLKVRI